MKRTQTISLGEFRELTKDMTDDAAILVVAPEGDAALAVQPHSFETSLDRQNAILLDIDYSESVRFAE